MKIHESLRTATYYPVAGAMRINSTLYYTLKDHLGSASVVTDASGNILGEQRYYPFGETRFATGSMYTDKLFTGQREMADLGIYHYNARFYSPYINRFLSADTIVPGYSNPQNLNRYSYVTNNPLRYTDPTGHMLCAVCEGEGGDGYTPPRPPEPQTPPAPDNEGNSPEPDLGGIDEELLEFCILHPYASNCSFALPPQQCDLAPVIGPPGTTYTAGGCRFAGFRTYTDWESLDWVGMGTNALGLLGFGVLVFSTIGGPTVIDGAIFYEASQGIGVAVDIYRLDQPGLTWDAVSLVASEVKYSPPNVPGLGAVINLGNMNEIINEATVTEPVFLPYPMPLHVPP